LTLKQHEKVGPRYMRVLRQLIRLQQRESNRMTDSEYSGHWKFSG
jgi:hypothetical protein